MARKIYDIKPPKVAQKTEKHIKEFLSEEKPTKKRRQKVSKINKVENAEKVERVERVEKVESVERKHNGKTRKPIWWPLPVGGLVVLAGIGIYLFLSLPEANVAIWPKVEALNIEKTLVADKSVEDVTLSGAKIPAYSFEAVVTNSQEFEATGNASDEGKASGTIVIYNKFDPPAPMTFRAGTHFMSDSGKLFISHKKIVIPAGKKTGGKVTPGSVQVEIEAVEGGTGYNIPPSTFTVPGLKGTSYYYSIYAESDDAMSGGFSGSIKKVTEDDIQTARNSLVEKTTSDALGAVRSKISSEYVLLENAVSSITTDASSGMEAGEVADKFNYNVSVKATALAFKKSEIEKFASDLVASQMPEGKLAVKEVPEITYDSSTIDISGGKATLSLNIKSDIYKSIDKDSIAIQLFSKSAPQIEEKIGDSLGEDVSKMEINFWPFWVSVAPKNQKKVNIELRFQ